MSHRHPSLPKTFAALFFAVATIAGLSLSAAAHASTVPLVTGTFASNQPSFDTGITLAAGAKRYIAASVSADYAMCNNGSCPVGDAANGDSNAGAWNSNTGGVVMGGGAVFVYDVAGGAQPVGKGIIVTGNGGTIKFGINDFTTPNLFSDNVGSVDYTIATNALVITNNGSYDRRYVNLDYTCGTDNQVLYSSTEQAGATGSNDDGTRPSTIAGTINTATGAMTWTYTRETYTSVWTGAGTWTDGTYTFTQNSPDVGVTGGVLNAAGTFINVPSCAPDVEIPAGAVGLVGLTALLGMGLAVLLVRNSASRRRSAG